MSLSLTQSSKPSVPSSDLKPTWQTVSMQTGSPTHAKFMTSTFCLGFLRYIKAVWFSFLQQSVKGK